MAEPGVFIGMYDAPGDPSFDEWLHGPYYRAMLGMPGVRSIQRLEVLDPSPGQQHFVVLIETDDIAATLRHRESDEWRRWQGEATAHGLTNRKLTAGRLMIRVSAGGS